MQCSTTISAHDTQHSWHWWTSSAELEYMPSKLNLSNKMKVVSQNTELNISWELTSSDEVLVVDTRVVHVMYDTCEYCSKYLEVSEDILHNYRHQSQLYATDIIILLCVSKQDGVKFSQKLCQILIGFQNYFTARRIETRTEVSNTPLMCCYTTLWKQTFENDKIMHTMKSNHVKLSHMFNYLSTLCHKICLKYPPLNCKQAHRCVHLLTGRICIHAFCWKFHALSNNGIPIVEKLWKSVRIWQHYCQNSTTLFETQVYTHHKLLAMEKNATFKVSYET